ncbi:hypothetical protein D7Y27_00775 [Corallococcus sp. AB004]|uniref:hypothetical protein n=1 Tax=Corallococcus exiguus TaxID=83462 RepID=UPI000EA28A61|nr:hypothetical protein [Corallococcus exiguus]NPC70306.1 hypothetical protein [Corallococcus exiguus]NPD22193.1 hypothetical protein [Corallococcus exiguus]RKI50996.1 hypothetical protein D7Y27_00775 [Corallococcus sp. AB004]
MWRSIRYSVDVHYSWAGPPNAQDRDINGPISLRGQLKDGLTTTYQMYFWCLDAEVAAFQRKFQARGIKNITVRGMQSFLSTCTGTAYRWWYWYGGKQDDVVARVTPIIQAAARPTATVRERVNAKNVWSFFVLYTWGGYHFDTGIEADTTRTVRLTTYNQYKAPAVLTERSIGYCHIQRSTLGGVNGMCSTVASASEWRDGHGRNSTEDGRVGYHDDVWALYAPRYDARVFRSLYWYCRIWDHLELKRRAIANERDEEAYKQASRYAVIDALNTGLSHTDKGACRDVEKADFWDAGASLNDGLIAELGIRKRYYGSHR